MIVSIGTKLNSYEITALLGRGGMGEVYRARDSKLKREVAIKILPEEFSREQARLGRFQREAEVLASLNHPNIGGIFDIQEQSGARFLVLELVEGETLAQRIAAGPIPVAEALNITLQICEALEAAHERGIVHRDLKPANVKVQPDGRVKVLDFGLAKALENQAASLNLSQLPTMSLAATGAGIIMGTAAYMSPEQARGLEIDQRTDVFALGCVLYEMLSGMRVFQGDTVSDILASVLKLDPDLSRLPQTLDPRIRELVRRCLEKNRRARWHAVGDVRIEIESVLAAPLETPVQSPPLRRRAAPVVAVVLLSALACSLIVWKLRPAPPDAAATRFSDLLPDGQELTGMARNTVAVSPDGASFVYVANLRLYLRRMGEVDAKAIPGTETKSGVWNPSFSPDGAFIAFYSTDDGMLKRIAVSGGAAVSLCKIATPLGFSWGEDSIVFGQSDVGPGGGGIFRVSANGGAPDKIIDAKAGETTSAPEMLPGGKAVLFSVATGALEDRWEKGRIVVQSIPSGARKVLLEGGSDARYIAATGQIVYAYAGTLRAVHFDATRLELQGGPTPVVEGVARTGVGSGQAHFGFSANGMLVFVAGLASGLSTTTLGLVDHNGTVEPLKLPTGTYSTPRISPDGRQVAFSADDGKEAIVFIYDISGAEPRRRLSFGGNNRYPVWSPDGKTIAYQSDREGDLAIFEQRADGTSAPERLTKPEVGAEHVPTSWSPDGQTLLFSMQKDLQNYLWTFSRRDKSTAPLADIRDSSPIDALFSPDGRWIAYMSRESGSDDIFVQTFPPGGAKYQVPNSRDNHAPVWTRDGKALVYITGPGGMAVAPITMKPSFSLGNPVDVFKGRNNAPTVSRDYDVMPDGQHVIRPVLPDVNQSSAYRIQIVQNWFEDIKRRTTAVRGQ